MRGTTSTRWPLLWLVAGLLSGCALGTSSDDGRIREPGFRASSIRRPALLVRVEVAGDVSQRERARIPEDYQAAVIEGLDRMGILPLDIATAAPGRGQALTRIDRGPALARARAVGADHLLIVDARLSRGDLRHCQQSGHALVGPTTYWDAGLEIDQVSDGKRLLVEPPAQDLRAVDVELDCKTGRLIRRRSMDELINDSVSLILTPFGSR